jgi:serine phosphatase RsbU (regulator of sigma subunit)
MRGDRAAKFWVTVLATVLLVAITALDLVLDGALVLAPLLVLAPMVASAVVSARVTAAFATLAVAAVVVAGWWDDSWATPQHYVRIVDVALVGSAAVLVAVVRLRRERRFARVAAIAEVAQRAILPTFPPQVGRVAIGTRYVSAAEDAVVGGDLYDCYYSQSRVRFLVGDVRGKGIAAVEQAARVIRAFRQSAAIQSELPAVARDMDAYLAPFFGDEEFVTALLVDASDPTSLQLVTCGHPPPLLIPATGVAALPEVPVALPLGLGGDYQAAWVPWGRGDRLLMYTDGLSEARDAQGHFLPLEGLVPLLRARGVEDALSALLEQVGSFVPGGSLTDDLAVMLLEHAGVEQPEARALPRGVPVELASPSSWSVTRTSGGASVET